MTTRPNTPPTRLNDFIADQFVSDAKKIAALKARVAELEAVSSEIAPLNATVWKDGSYLCQSPADDHQCQQDPEWLCSIPLVSAYKPAPLDRNTIIEECAKVCEEENADASEKYRLALKERNPTSMAICGSAGMAAERIKAKIRALKNAAPQGQEVTEPCTTSSSVAPAVAARSGPDFNQEVNLHADTIAERHDANWTCGCGHVNGCNLECCAMCLRRPNGRHKDE